MSARPPAATVKDFYSIIYPLQQREEGESAAMLSAVPEEVRLTHRVQLSARGRRFEMAMDVATSSFIAFHAFFLTPIALENLPGSLKDRVEQELGELITYHSDTSTEVKLSNEASIAVWDLVKCASDAREMSEALLTHFRVFVQPRVAAGVRAILQQHFDSSDSSKEAGETDATITSFAECARRLSELPPVPCPENITWCGEANSRQWQFIFPRRGEELLHDSSSGSDGAEYDADKDLHLLQAEYIGAMLVYLRRSLTAPTTTSLPIRWHEMDLDQQTRFAQVVLALGIVPFITRFSLPTAAQTPEASTSEQNLNSSGSAGVSNGVDPSIASLAAATLGSVTGHHKANEEEEEKVRQLRAEMQPGCSRCGMAGHVEAACPY